MANLWDTDFASALKQDNSFNMLPFGVQSPGGAAPAGAGGTDWMQISSILAGLGTALAPERYNRWGTKVPSWQEKLGTTVGGMARANMKAKALAAPGAGTINPILLQLLLAGGK